jgi:Adenylate and Guanylate cyclase catalytic domain
MKVVMLGGAVLAARRDNGSFLNHSGTVVAGVIGKKKFSYDLWGDTVNAAARLEAHGLPGRGDFVSKVREAGNAVRRYRNRTLVPRPSGDTVTLGPISPKSGER